MGEKGEELPHGYMVDQGILRFKGRIVLPSNSSLTTAILKEYHDTPIGGHLGNFKTYQSIAQEWFWPGMRKQITTYVFILFSVPIE